MIGDVKSRAVVEFSADVTDLKRGIGEVIAQENKLLETQLKGQTANNARMESTIATLGKVAAVAGVVGVAGKALWEGWEHSARRAQLASNVNLESLERLRKGFGGLRSEMQALESANALSQSKFKLTGQQMETVGKAMRQLVREGHDWEEVNKKVTESFVKLNGGGLDDFGIHVRDAATESGKFNAILDAMTQKSGKLSDTTKTNAERMAEMKVRFSDTMDQVKQSLGEIAVALLPVIEALAQVVSLAASLASSARISQNDVIQQAAADKTGKLRSLNVARPTSYTQAFLDGLGMLSRGLGVAAEGVADYGVDPWGRSGEKTRGKPSPYSGTVRSLLGDVNTGGYGYGAESQGLGSHALTGDEFGRDLMSTIDLSKYGRTQSVGDEYTAYQSSKLEGIFGPLSEFDAYKTAFETLNGAIGTAFGAWIDGSASAGEAFKKFIGEALKGVAVQMAMEAVKHGAYALGNLAFGNFAGAAMHGKAAAGFAAGAILVGAAAKQLHTSGGGGGGTGATAPGGGVPSYSGGNSSGGGGSHTTIVYGGPDFHGSSDRQRMLAARRITNAAQVSLNGTEMR